MTKSRSASAVFSRPRSGRWVGNSGVSALGPYGVHCTNIAKAMSASGCAPVNYVGRGPLQAASPSSAGRIAADRRQFCAPEKISRVHLAKPMPGIHGLFSFRPTSFPPPFGVHCTNIAKAMSTSGSAQAHSRLRGRHVNEWKTPQSPGDIVLEYLRRASMSDTSECTAWLQKYESVTN